MSRFASIPIVGGSYADDSRPFTAQDTVGWIPQNAEGPGTRSPSKLTTPPGLQEFASAGTKQRGAHNVEGKFFCVSGSGLYQLMPNGAAHLLGAIPGTSRVSMAHNQISGGNQLKIVTGSAGYIWNTVTETLTRITDPGYPGEIVTEFIGALFVGIEPQRRYFFNSALADGLNYNTNETYQGEASPDRLVCLKPIHSELAVFSEGTIEFFEYTGTVNALFRNKAIVVEQGAASPFCVSTLDNSLFFVGADGNGYRMDGYTPIRITTHAIEQAWAKCDRSKCFAFTWEDRGHKVWYVTFPDGHTWGFDVATQLWHRRQSEGMNRWRLSWLVKWNKQWYGGEYNSGRVFLVNWDYIMEGSDPLPRERVLGVGHDNQNLMLLEAFEAVFDTGGPETVPGPVFALSFDLEQNVADGVTLGGDLPDGDLGDTVDFRYRTKGGVWPITFAYSDGFVPTGCAANGESITGTFTVGGTYSWTVTATDAVGSTATLDDTCVVVTPLILSGTLADGTVAVAYSSSLTASGGVPPYSGHTVTAGTLPDGVTLTTSTGATVTFAGTPT